MVTQLLTLLRNTPDGLTLMEASRQLGAHPAAVAGMLELLTRTGRLVAVGPDGGFCVACGQAADCRLLALHGARYVVAPRASMAVS